MGGKAWSEEALRNLWVAWASDKSYKEQMHLFPDRTHEGVRKEGRYRFGAKPAPYARPEAISVALIRQVLANTAAPLSAKSISERINVSRTTVMEMLNANSGTKFRVAGYEIVGRHRSKLWAIGPGEEAERPPRLTRTEVTRRQRRRAKERALVSGEVVRNINPFAVAAGLVAIPEGRRGRIFQQDMSIDEWHQSKEAA